MQLNKISILNYKNILQADLEFLPKINCFIGNNGVGKTNVLDAIYYLSFCKSNTNYVDSQNINHNEEFFMIEGSYTRKGVTEDIYCGLKQRQRKVFKRNKRDYERITDHIGLLPLVLVSPADSDLISGGGEERRKFIDGVISQYDNHYLTALLRYGKTVTQRNSLLKNEQIDMELIDILNVDLVEAGEYIFEKRNKFIQSFMPVFQRYYNFIAENKETVGLAYNSLLTKNDFMELLQQNFDKDCIMGYTSKGVHKDDLEMTLEGYPIKREGSQGQNKTYLIALKLAQFDFLKQASGVNPILLLDDIFDKLDAERVRQIIKLVSEDYFGQIFITDTNRKNLDDILSTVDDAYRLFMVSSGEISPLQ